MLTAFNQQDHYLIYTYPKSVPKEAPIKNIISTLKCNFWPSSYVQPYNLSKMQTALALPFSCQRSEGQKAVLMEEISWSPPIFLDFSFHFNKGNINNAFKLFIRITCPCNEHPLTPHFYIEKVGFTRVYTFFLYLLQNIDCGYSLEPPC